MPSKLSDLDRLIGAMMAIRDNDPPYPQAVARECLKQIDTIVDCECAAGRVACNSPECFGGNKRDGSRCIVCGGTGEVICPECHGRGWV